MQSLDLINYLREVNTVSIIVRLTLATICAGIIGAERGRRNRPAGFRTHILVCIGATIIMITNQYMTDVLNLPGDASRMGAQVISEIGFIKLHFKKSLVNGYITSFNSFEKQGK